MTRHVTSVKRLLTLAALACCEAALRALGKVVDRAARKRPKADPWPDEDYQ